VQGAGTPDRLVTGLTVRARTSDGADVRVLAELTTEGDETQVVRLAHALVTAEIARRTAELELEELVAGLSATAAAVPGRCGEAVAAVGGRLRAVELVAVEHLLVSPSSDRADHGPR
jgi:Tfp pilus assembly PilM family ATPase